MTSPEVEKKVGTCRNEPAWAHLPSEFSQLFFAGKRIANPELRLGVLLVSYQTARKMGLPIKGIARLIQSTRDQIIPSPDEGGDAVNEWLDFLVKTPSPIQPPHALISNAPPDGKPTRLHLVRELLQAGHVSLARRKAASIHKPTLARRAQRLAQSGVWYEGVPVPQFIGPIDGPVDRFEKTLPRLIATLAAHMGTNPKTKSPQQIKALFQLPETAAQRQIEVLKPITAYWCGGADAAENALQSLPRKPYRCLARYLVIRTALASGQLEDAQRNRGRLCHPKWRKRAAHAVARHLLSTGKTKRAIQLLRRHMNAVPDQMDCLAMAEAGLALGCKGLAGSWFARSYTAQPYAVDPMESDLFDDIPASHRFHINRLRFGLLADLNPKTTGLQPGSFEKDETILLKTLHHLDSWRNLKHQLISDGTPPAVVFEWLNFHYCRPVGEAFWAAWLRDGLQELAKKCDVRLKPGPTVKRMIRRIESASPDEKDTPALLYYLIQMRLEQGLTCFLNWIPRQDFMDPRIPRMMRRLEADGILDAGFTKLWKKIRNDLWHKHNPEQQSTPRQVLNDWLKHTAPNINQLQTLQNMIKQNHPLTSPAQQQDQADARKLMRMPFTKFAEGLSKNPQLITALILKSPPRTPINATVWSQQDWREICELFPETKVDPKRVSDFLRLVPKAYRQAVEEFVYRGLKPENAVIPLPKQPKVRLRWLDKRHDLPTLLRFADCVWSCYHSDCNYYDDPISNTRRAIVELWRDSLSFCFHIEKEVTQGWKPVGHVFGNFAAQGTGVPAILLNGIYMNRNRAGIRDQILATLESKLCLPLGIGLLASANVNGGWGVMPDRYEVAETIVKRYRALIYHKRNGDAYDDISTVINRPIEMNNLYWTTLELPDQPRVSRRS